MLFQLHELILENYYNGNVLEEKPHCDIILKSSHFNWGKHLTPEEIKQLHSNIEKKSLKGKGKGKLSESLKDTSDVEQRIFELHDVNIEIKKVRQS